MKYCGKCGKEILDEAVVCPACGCAVKKSEPMPVKASTSVTAPDAKGFLIGGLVTLVAGILVFLFVSVWVGELAELAALIIFACSRTKTKKYIQSVNPGIGKPELKKAIKEFEAENSTSKACFVLSIVSFCIFLLCIFFFW